jgi:hypothetical protein
VTGMGAGGYSIVVRSIGRASPAVCQQIGAVLSLPAATIIKRIYQAPAVLMEGLGHDDGRKIRDVLDEAGLVVDLEPEPVGLGPAALFDVAVHIRNIEAFTAVGARLAEFLGCQPEEAERLLETPPGVVLGDVSEATIQALTRRLDGLGTNVVAADKQQSAYDLFLLEADRAARSAMLRDLRASGEACDDSAHAVILRGLSYDAAAAIWRRHQSAGSLRVINQAFEQWDIVLDGSDGSDAGLDALSVTAGIPREVCAKLIGHLPLVIEESVSNAALQERLQMYANSRLDVRAVLTTLRAVKLTIINGPANPSLDPFRKSRIDKENHGLHSYPFVWPDLLYDLQARRLQQRLGAAGYEIELQES